MSSNSPDGVPPKESGKKRSLAGKVVFAVGLLYASAVVAAIIYMGYTLYQWGDYKPLIEKVVSSAIKAEFTAEKIDFHIRDGAGVSLSGMKINHNGRSVVAVKNLTAKINLWESLKGSLALTSLTMKDPVFNVVKRRDGTFNIPLINKAPSSKRATGMAAAAMALLAVFEKADIENATMRWEDRHASLKPVIASLSNVMITFARKRRLGDGSINISGTLKQKNGKPTPFSLSGKASNIEINDSGAKAKLTARVSINDLSVSHFWPYLKHHIPFQKFNSLLSWNGSFNGELGSNLQAKGELTFADIRLRLKEAFTSDVRPPKLTITYDASMNQQTLSVKNAVARMGDIEVQTKGKITDYKSANPKIEISINTNDINVKKLKQYLPDKALTAQQSGFIKRNLDRGVVTLKNFKFDGDLDKLRHLNTPESLSSFSGTLQVSKLKIAFSGLTYPFEDIDGAVSLAGDKLMLSKVKGRYGSSVLREISGLVSNIHEWPAYTIYMKADVDLMEGKKLLAGLTTAPELKKRIEQMEQMNGEVKMDVVVAGAVKNPVTSLTMDGKISFENVGMSHTLVGVPIVGMNGSVELSLNDMNIKRLEWQAGESSFTFAGKIKNIFKSDPSFDLRLLSKLALDDINKLRFITFGEIYDHSGNALLEMNIQGDFNSFEISNLLDMTNARYRFRDIIQKEHGLRNIFTFTGTVRKREKLKIKKLVMDLGESRLTLQGEVEEFLKGEGINLTLESDGILMNDLDRFLHGFEDIDAGGYVRGKLSIVKKKEGEDPKMFGRLRFENADFKLPIFRGVFRECNGDFELLNGSLFLKNGDGKFNGGKFRLTARGKIKSKPRFTLNIDADSLNLIDLLKDPDKKREPDKKEPPLWTWEVVGKSKKGTIGNIHYQNLGMKMIFKDKKFHFEPFTFTAYGGVFSWEGDVAILKNNRVSIDSKLDVQDMEMGEYLRDISKKEEVISGKLNLRGSVKGFGEDWSAVKKSLEGSLTVSSGAGVIRKFNVLGKIFSLLNVSQYFKLKVPNLSVDGMPFENITANFKISSGVARTDNLKIDSEAMRIAGTGGYNISNTELDMRVAVMPFVAVDRLLSNIPLVGHILAGDKKGFIAFYFISKGPVKNPDTEAIPFQSLGLQAAGIIQRILELPIKAIYILGGKKFEGAKNDGNDENISTESNN